MKWLNIILLQWFFIRLTNCTVREVVSFDIFGRKYQEYYWYSIQFFVLPLTGWDSEFVYIGKPRFYRITSKKLVK